VAAVHSPRSACKVWLWLGVGLLLVCCGGLGGGAYWVVTTYGSRFGLGPGARLNPYASPSELRAQMPEAVAALKSRDPWARSRGADVLMMLGREAESTVPDLIPLLGDREWRVRASAAGALCRMGSAAAPAVPDLVRLLESEANDEVKVKAATAIAGVGRQFGARAYSALMRLRSDPGPEVRDAAAIALGTLGDPSVSADLARLIAKGDNWNVWAIWAAGYVGPRGKESMEALGRAVTDPDRDLQLSALWAVARCGPGDSEKLKIALYKLMGDPDSEVRLPATIALGLSGDERAYESLVGLLGSPEEPIRAWALHALCGLREKAAGCAGQAEMLLADQDPEVRREALALLSGIGPKSAEHLSAMVDALGDSDASVRARAAWAVQCVAFESDEAAQALARLGDAGRPAIPKLREALDTDPELRAAAAASLARWHDPAAKPILLELVASKSSADRINTAAGFYYFPEAAKEARDGLHTLLADHSFEQSTIRMYAASALGRSGDRSVTDALLEQCSDASATTSFFAALALYDLGHPRGKAVLQALAREGPRPTRIAARKALEGALGY